MLTHLTIFCHDDVKTSVQYVLYKELEAFDDVCGIVMKDDARFGLSQFQALWRHRLDLYELDGSRLVSVDQ